MSEPEEYSVEWFRWVAANNPKWLGPQALQLWRHYEALEGAGKRAELDAILLKQNLLWLLEDGAGWDLRAAVKKLD